MTTVCAIKEEKCSLLQRQISSFLTFCPLIHLPSPLPVLLLFFPPDLQLFSLSVFSKAVSSPAGPRAGHACSFSSPLIGTSPGAASPSALPQTLPEVLLQLMPDLQNEDCPAAVTQRTAQPDLVALPIRAYGFPDKHGNQLLQYWPFFLS